MKDQYRRIARFYDALIDPPNVLMRRIGASMLPLHEGMTVLEIGCGTGSNLLLYQQKGCNVAGVDLSPSMLEVARAKLGESADLRECDARDMPFEDGSFDLVTAFLALHEMPTPVRESVLDEMTRVAGDGHVLLVDFNPGPLRFPKGWLIKPVIFTIELMAGREHFGSYRDFLARRGLPGLVEKRSLTVVEEKALSGGNVLACLLSR